MHLNHKSCDIDARKLTLIWIEEGMAHQIRSKRLPLLEHRVQKNGARPVACIVHPSLIGGWALAQLFLKMWKLVKPAGARLPKLGHFLGILQ